MLRRVLVGGALVLAACAHSGGSKACDPTSEACACGPGEPDCPSGSTCDTTQKVCVESPDANLNTTPDADLTPDAKPKNGFGQPCQGGQDCESAICILTSTGGVCSQLCGQCPDGWGCFGVLGAIDPGEVSNVCVPLTTQLCTQCAQDTECAQVGMDKCITEPTGRAYCGRDCSTISCPTGYDCDKVTLGGADYKECVPHSGACDCNSAAQQGATDACSITTTLGTTCAGTSTCGGTAGWGSCTPPSSTDDPDGSYQDDNCDGIDGDLAKGIFVAGAGADSSTCGLTYQTPCQTISFGIVRAVQAGKQNVYVQAGTYNEVVVLLSGINIWGGYDFNWQRGPYSSPGHTVTITGKQDTSTGGDGEWMTVRAHNLIVPVTMGDLVIQGPQAQGTGGSSGLDGKSSYGVHVNAATLTLVRVQIKGGNGAPGATGGAGADAVIVDAQSYMQGAQGGNGQVKGDVCNDSTRGAGGNGASNSCSSSPSSRNMSGGRGGDGGTEDSSCTIGLCGGSACNATPGASGANASFVANPYGTGGGGGSGVNVCGPAGDGQLGFDVNGPAGGATNGGYVVGNGYWYAHGGSAGGTGENGGGGGGGGGAGGCDNGNDSYGGGGGGGGAGGCAARGGGGGGGGGGASFAVFATGTSTVTAASCDIVLGVAGAGGAGGSGGRGQSGGAAGLPGARANNGSSPGYGGAGAHGGHGGGGGGGQGGRAVGVGWTPGSTIDQTCTFSGGAAGMGGAGGLAAPFAPQAERDGNNGASGATGSVDQTRQCNGTGDC